MDQEAKSVQERIFASFLIAASVIFSAQVSGIGPVTLKPEWARYEIDLAGKDLSSIIGGFMFVASAKRNPQGFVFYLDDIYFE